MEFLLLCTVLSTLDVTIGGLLGRELIISLKVPECQYLYFFFFWKINVSLGNKKNHQSPTVRGRDMAEDAWLLVFLELCLLSHSFCLCGFIQFLLFLYSHFLGIS